MRQNILFYHCHQTFYVLNVSCYDIEMSRVRICYAVKYLKGSYKKASIPLSIEASDCFQ
mgnify:CR=1 FL=1